MLPTNANAEFQAMQHPKTGEQGVWGSKIDFMDATIAYEVQKAKAEAWEQSALRAGGIATEARTEIEELKTHVARIPGLIEQGKKAAFVKGKSTGRTEAITLLGLLGALALLL